MTDLKNQLYKTLSNLWIVQGNPSRMGYWLLHIYTFLFVLWKTEGMTEIFQPLVLSPDGVMAQGEPGWSPDPQLQSGLPHWQSTHALRPFSPALPSAFARSAMQQLGFEPVPLCDVNTMVGALTYYATTLITPTLAFFFSFFRRLLDSLLLLLLVHTILHKHTQAWVPRDPELFALM